MSDESRRRFRGLSPVSADVDGAGGTAADDVDGAVRFIACGVDDVDGAVRFIARGGDDDVDDTVRFVACWDRM